MPFPLQEHSRKTILKHFGPSFEWSEEFFINVLETSERKYDVYWAAIALRDGGSARAIPSLKARLRHPKKDVKSSAILTIAHIAGASETMLYADSLLASDYPEKGYAMWAIADAADERAIPAVLEYLTKHAARLRTAARPSGTLTNGLAYLRRMQSHDPRIAPLLEQFAGHPTE